MWAAEKQIDAAAISTLGFDKAAVEAVKCFETGDMVQFKDSETLDFSNTQIEPSKLAVLGAVLRSGFHVPFVCSVLTLVSCGLGPEGGKVIASALETNLTVTQVRAVEYLCSFNCEVLHLLFLTCLSPSVGVVFAFSMHWGT